MPFTLLKETSAVSGFFLCQDGSHCFQTQLFDCYDCTIWVSYTSTTVHIAKTISLNTSWQNKKLKLMSSWSFLLKEYYFCFFFNSFSEDSKEWQKACGRDVWPHSEGVGSGKIASAPVQWAQHFAMVPLNVFVRHMKCVAVFSHIEFKAGFLIVS